MEFIHISDIHYGMEPKWGDVWQVKNSLQRIVDVCNERKTNLLLVSGDLFHSIPGKEALREVDYVLSKLVCTRVFVIAGNHDYISRGGIYENYVFESNTYVFKPGEYYCEEVIDGVNVAIWGISYDGMYMTEYKDVKAIAEKCPVKDEFVNILMLHGGTANQLDVDFGKLAENGYDYIALGHIHKPQIISDTIAYAGSLESLDKNETGEHGYILGNIDEASEYHGKRTKVAFTAFANRRIEEITVEVNRYMTLMGVKDRIISKMCDKSAHYIVVIKGVATHKNEELTEKRREYVPELKELLKNEGVLSQIVEMIDDSKSYDDLDEIYKDNIGNVIGRFIEKTRLLEDEELEDYILDYGLDALNYSKGGDEHDN